MRALTKEEKSAVAAVRRVAKRWPRTLTIVLDGRGKLRAVDHAAADTCVDLADVDGEDLGFRSVTGHS